MQGCKFHRIVASCFCQTGDIIDGTGTGSRTRSSGCLSDALVSVGPAGHGGTGSFVSADGLIITNHHVAHDAVRRASTPDNDLLTATMKLKRQPIIKKHQALIDKLYA